MKTSAFQCVKLTLPWWLFFHKSIQYSTSHSASESYLLININTSEHASISLIAGRTEASHTAPRVVPSGLSRMATAAAAT